VTDDRHPIGERFERFFSAVHPERDPYPWQTRLVESIAREGRWPVGISIPTGAGKSSVVDVHVFLVAERERARWAEDAACADVAWPPRRLVLVAPRRVLVEDQFDHAQHVAARLRAAVSKPDKHERILVEVAESLLALRSAEQSTADSAFPLSVSRLRGGVRLDLDWRLDPGQCQVICATPQMWGSRLLLRGFRGTRRSRNLETGLLGHDVAVVIDEAHLCERLVETATRVARDETGALGLQVVSMSATRALAGAIRLTDEDLSNDELRRRVSAHKTISVIPVEGWRKNAASELAQAGRKLAREGTVGVFVNTVAMALDVAGRLPGTVVVVCGRMRPADVARLRRQHLGLLDARGNPNVDFLVATQSLEVGADLDLPGIVTEVASANALAQRAGRLNRGGNHDRSELVVVAPSDPAMSAAALDRLFAPYSGAEIVAAMQWVESLDGDASPLQISTKPLPVPERRVLPALTRVELETFAIADQELSADADAAFYIEEPNDEAEMAISIGARRHLDLLEQVVREMLEAAPPRAHELASFRLGTQLDMVLDAVFEMGRSCWLMREQNGRRTAEPLRRDERSKPSSRLRAGDAVLVPDDVPVCTGGIVGLAGKGPFDTLADVTAGRPDGEPDMIVKVSAKLVRAALDIDETFGSRAARTELAEALADNEPDVARALKGHRLGDLEVTWCAGNERDADLGLLVLSSTRSEGRLPGTAVTEQPGTRVTIDDHCAAVEKRLDRILDRLDVDVPVALGAQREQLLAAARWHDAGKRHPRFQKLVGANPDDPPLAKPVPGHRTDRVDRGDGWRHEQPSAAYAWARCGRDPVSTISIGTHHGFGLSGFNRGPRDLLHGWDSCEPDIAEAVNELFGERGRYELEHARLIRVLGLHRLSFLEALLRCADMQVSKEGS
jgi:CRISPR-associated endonuclease/helicase Cas3